MGLPRILRVGIIEVVLDLEHLKPLVQEIAQKTTNWDELNWLLAEAELRLFPAYAFHPTAPIIGSLPLRIQLFPARVVQQPREEQIRSLAWDISQRHLSIQDLHYFIAQRKYIFKVIQESHK